MNNWRLLLLAVVAVLQPSGSFTEPNHIDGRQDCCDHRSNSITQETRLNANYRKAIPEDRRLNLREVREDRRSEVRNDPIRKERQAAEIAERRASPESARFRTEARFTRGQERWQRAVDIREPRQTREDQSRRIRDTVSRDSLSRYERDVLDSRRIRMSRDNTRTGRASNERVYESRDNRRERDSEDFRRVSVTRQTDTDRRGNNDVARDESRLNSRLATFREENRMQNDNNRERRSLDRRVRDNTEENRRSRSLEAGANSFERDSRRTSFRTVTERVDERRQRDHNRESRDRTIVTTRDSSETVSAVRRRESPNTAERVYQSRRNMREYLSTDSIMVQTQRRTETVRSREPFQERRESRLNAERSQPIMSRESRALEASVRSERPVRSDDRIDVQREVTRDVVRAYRPDIKERRQDTRVLRTSESTTMSDRVGRRQPLTRSLDRVRSNEREFTARISERVREERSLSYRRVRSDERLETQRQQRSESPMSRNRQIAMLRESRDNTDRRQEARRTVPSRIEVNARSERESRVRELRDDARDVNRRTRDVHAAARDSRDSSERRQETRNTSPSRFEVNSRVERESRIRDLHDNLRDGIRHIREERMASRETRDISERRQDARSPSRIEVDTRSERESRNRELRDDVRDVNRRAREERSAARESRENSERRQHARSPSRIEVNARSERESRIRELRDNVREESRRAREERTASRDQRLSRMARETEHRDDGPLSRASRVTERAASEERMSRVREETNTERRVSRRDTRDQNRATTMVQREVRDASTAQRRFDTRGMSRIQSNDRLQRSRTLEDIRGERREARMRDDTRASRDNTRLSMERREIRDVSRDSRTEARNEIIRNRGVVSTRRVESRREDSRSQDRVLRREVRDATERRFRDTGSRDVEMRSERLTSSRDERRMNGNVDTRIRSAETRRESRMMEKEVQPNRHNLAMERLDRTALRVNRHVRIESKLRSSDFVLAKDTDTRREIRDTRFRSLETKVREINPIDETVQSQNGMSWQMVFYTLQGAYVCGLLMQMLTEKSNKGKSKHITAWWSSIPKDLVKVN